MSAVKRNLIANFIGIGWSGLLIVALVPVYVHFLGVEAYGLVGFQLSLQAIAALLDFGLGTTVNRELARLSAADVPAKHARGVVRTAEVLYWTIAAAIAIVLYAAAPFLATRWFSPHDLSPSVISTALRFMALATAIRFPYALYSSGLYGLQRHIILNAVLSGATTIRAAGTIIVVLIARDVRFLFAWEMIAALLLTGAAAAALHHVMPRERRDGRFELALLADARAFMLGVGAIGILVAVNTQVDKLTVSKLLPLHTFGYYTIGTTLAATVLAVVSPIWLTVFPRFSQLVAQGDEVSLSAAYHRAAQALAVVLLPIVALIFFFGRDIVELWTGDAVAASETRWLIVLLVAGAALNALMSVPYALQLANAWPTPALLVNGVGIVFLIPATILATLRFGAMGAASCWLAFHLTSFVVGMTMTHARLLRGERFRWLWNGVILPAAIAVLVAGAGRLLTSGGSKIVQVVLIAITGAAAFLATAVSTPVVREWIAEQRLRRQTAGGGR